ncbi:hypothetical protein RRG08_064181 [Elysia crispata]|uniref:Uncharacterized protein n=1 Tax=Elysia crispata TaxID=231223 RepID=A0AAE0YG10_9GAST|nr:hypothetical protein RRG08_064181 [Elysia crispata]
MATQRRPPRGRLRLSQTPPLINGGEHVPPVNTATTSRPNQQARLAGRERKTTTIRSTQEMPLIETITCHHALVPDASPGRGTVVPQSRAPGIRTLVFERSPESSTTLDPATPEFIPGVPYRQPFQEAAPESRVRGHTTYADAAGSPPLNIYLPAPRTRSPTAGAGHQEVNTPVPETLNTSESPPHHPPENRPTPVTSIMAGQVLEGTGAGLQDMKVRGAIQGEKITFPLPIPGIITCDLCRPPVSWRRKKSNHRDALRHLQEQHDARFVAAFRCQQCGYATTTLHAGNRHLTRSCAGVRALEEAPQEMNIFTNPINQYPGMLMSPDEYKAGQSFKAVFLRQTASLESLIACPQPQKNQSTEHLRQE